MNRQTIAQFFNMAVCNPVLQLAFDNALPITVSR